MLRSATLFAFGLCLTAVPALAQVGPGGAYGGAGYGPGVGTNPGLSSRGTGQSHGSDDDSSKDKDDKPVAPPPAIPGAQPDPDAAVIPADKLAAEMSPNDALFDAITRGDLAAAKDALSRGAQLDAHNVLGQTPTDASIDLNRNDITFLLLSMRGTVPSARAPSRAVAEVSAPAKAAHVKTAVRPAAARVADRGTPNPAVGFIGF
jgi:hypothetical protein